MRLGCGWQERENEPYWVEKVRPKRPHHQDPCPRVSEEQDKVGALAAFCCPLLIFFLATELLLNMRRGTLEPVGELWRDAQWPHFSVSGAIGRGSEGQGRQRQPCGRAKGQGPWLQEDRKKKKKAAERLDPPSSVSPELWARRPQVASLQSLTTEASLENKREKAFSISHV